MRIRSLVLCIGAAFFSTLTIHANITGIQYHDDGDGAIVCPVYPGGSGDSVNVDGYQYWGPGHIIFDITTDTPLDPTLALFNSIDNDTSFTWTGYEVDISMNKTFTISAPAVTSPGDWTLASLAQPGSPVAGVYTGQMLFMSGTPLAIGGTLDFQFQLSFLGGVSFTEQLTPIPEPGTAALVLVSLGLAACRWVKR